MSLSQFLSRSSPRRLAFTFFWVMFGGTILVLGYFYVGAVRYREADIRKEAIGLAMAAASMVDVDLHEHLIRAEQGNSAEYRSALRPLIRLHRDFPNIQYLWTTRVAVPGSRVLVLQTSIDEGIRNQQLQLGRTQDILPFLTSDPNPETEAAKQSIPILRGGRAWVADDIYQDTHGSYIEARAPLLDREGRFVGYLGVDYALDAYLDQIDEVRVTALIALALALLVSVVVAREVAGMRRQTNEYIEQVRQAEAEMRAQRDLAAAANNAKSELLAIASHDLKNPLSAVAGMAGMMLQEKLALPKTAEVQEDINTLETIRASAQHLSDIVRGILTTEGLEHGSLKFEPVPVDLSDLCATVIRFNVPAAKRKGIAVEADISPGLALSGDAKLLREACDNLLSNAVKYSPPNRTITVIARKKLGEPEVEFSVRDEGPGLSLEDQAKLYRKFQKLTARPTAGETSTGLGLSIVKTIVELHHGRVGCESQLGHGARFWIRLPLSQPDVVKA